MQNHFLFKQKRESSKDAEYIWMVKGLVGVAI